MLIENTPLLQNMKDKMHWLSDRQTLLSQNIANADTPGYKAQDLKPFAAHLDKAGSMPALMMARTSGTHIAPKSETLSGKPIVDRTSEGSVDNSVVMEDQVKKGAETAIDYQLVTNLYRKEMSLLRMATGSR